MIVVISQGLIQGSLLVSFYEGFNRLLELRQKEMPVLAIQKEGKQ
jgi:hypothetical protein